MKNAFLSLCIIKNARIRISKFLFVGSNMVTTVSKSSTPVVAPDHPAHGLSIVLSEQAENLAKLQPIYFANDQIQDDHIIHTVRNSYEYIYVMHWITHCRGFIKMESEYFDIDLFEIELLNMVYPPPLNDLVLFIHKLKRLLVNSLPGKNTESFERIFHLWFESKAQRQNKEESNHETKEEDEADVNDKIVGSVDIDDIDDIDGNDGNDDIDMDIEEEIVLPPFDNLLFEEKIHILYVWMVYLTSLGGFRAYLDKKGLHADELRMNPIWLKKISDDTSEEWLLLFNSTRLYARHVTQPALKVPKKRKLTPENPEQHFGEAAFDVAKIEFELVAKGIYQINDLIEKLASQKKQKESKEKYRALNDKESIEELFNAEIKKRRLLASRRKDIQMSNLLATRKRSSRIEAKEKEKLEEEQRQRERLEELKVLEAQRRMERRMAVRNDAKAAVGLTRQDRARLRRENVVDSPSSEPISAEETPFPEENVEEGVEEGVDESVEESVDVEVNNAEEEGARHEQLSEQILPEHISQQAVQRQPTPRPGVETASSHLEQIIPESGSISLQPTQEAVPVTEPEITTNDTETFTNGTETFANDTETIGNKTETTQEQPSNVMSAPDTTVPSPATPATLL